METPLQLTIGVEFEFIIRYNPEKYRPHMSGRGIAPLIEFCYCEQQKLDIMVRCHVIGILGKCGFRVNPYSFLGEFQKGYDKWSVVPDGSIKSTSEMDDPRWAGMSFTGVEVRTPAYPLCSKAIKEIQQVLHILDRCFDVFVNSSCGLHVHVGMGRAGFPVNTVKNLCSLVTGFERQFNSLHPLDRIYNLYTKPPGRVLPFSSPSEKLKTIDVLGSISDFVQLFNMTEELPDSSTAYNLANLQYGDKHTIEFRQHAGTLDPIAVTKWIELVTGLVTLCHTTPYPAFNTLLQEHINDPRFTIAKLLHALNLHEVAEFYRLRGTFTHPLQEWDWVDASSSFSSWSPMTESLGSGSDPDKENMPITTDGSISTDPAVLLAEINAVIASIPSIEEFTW